MQKTKVEPHLRGTLYQQATYKDFSSDTGSSSNSAVSGVVLDNTVTKVKNMGHIVQNFATFPF